ncbi:hypothetical protein ACJX0J_021040, partial [Zea mays]
RDLNLKVFNFPGPLFKHADLIECFLCCKDEEKRIFLSSLLLTFLSPRHDFFGSNLKDTTALHLHVDIQVVYVKSQVPYVNAQINKGYMHAVVTRNAAFTAEYHVYVRDSIQQYYSS